MMHKYALICLLLIAAILLGGCAIPRISVGPACGNLECEADENAANCPQDCGVGVLFWDDFEDGDAVGWSLGDGFSVVSENGNYVLQGTQHSFASAGSEAWSDYRFESRVLVSQGALHINFRQRAVEGVGLVRYALGLGSEGYIGLMKQVGPDFYHDLAASTYENPGTWHTVRIDALNLSHSSLIKVYIDGVKKITYEDPEPIMQGAISFEPHQEPVSVWIDDVLVTEIMPGVCGNEFCEPAFGENSTNCLRDCVPYDENCKGPYVMGAPPDFAPDVTHSGDLTISGNETMLIENEKYLQQGNIYINDQAKLIIRNSQFVLGRGAVPTIHAYFFVSENASLEIENSLVFPEPVQEGMRALVVVRNSGTVTITDSPTSIHLLTVSDGAQLTMTNSEMVFTIGGLLQVEGGDIRLINSTIGAIGLDVPANAHLTLTGLRSGNYFESWDVHEIIPEADYNVVLEKSCILRDDFTGELEHGPFERGWQFSLNPDAHVRISDSELRKASIDLRDEEALFENLKIGKPSGLHYRDIILDDVIMMGQWPFTLTDANLTITNSDYLFLQPSWSSNLNLVNSHMVEFIPRDFFGTVVFENSEWTNAGEIIGGQPYHSMYNNFTIKGGIKFGPELREHLQWIDATVTREYEVQVNDASGAPISGALIEIGGNKSVTDSNGKGKFSLIFDEFNYLSPITLKVFDGNSLLPQREIDFFTDTPIIVEKSA